MDTRRAASAIFAFTVLAGAACVAPPAHAQARGGFELGVELFDYGYRERFDGSTVARHDGTQFGVSGAYTARIGSGWFLRAELAASSGTSDIRAGSGILVDPDAPQFDPGLPIRIDGVQQGTGRLELVAGRTFGLGNGVELSPFAGIGVRVMIDEAGGRQSADGFLGYDREVGFGYLPLGAVATVPVGRGARLRLAAQYNQLLGGRVESKFSRLNPELPDVSVRLDGGRGYEFSARAELPLGRRMLAVGPFVRYWDIDRSRSFRVGDPSGSGETIQFFEPENRTTKVGLRMNLAF